MSLLASNKENPNVNWLFRLYLLGKQTPPIRNAMAPNDKTQFCNFVVMVNKFHQNPQCYRLSIPRTPVAFSLKSITSEEGGSWIFVMISNLLGSVWVWGSPSTFFPPQTWENVLIFKARIETSEANNWNPSWAAERANSMGECNCVFFIWAHLHRSLRNWTFIYFI